MRRLLWILLAALSAALLALIARNITTGTAMSRPEAASLALKAITVVFVSALVLALLRDRLSRALESALVWVAIALLVAIGYSYRPELHEIANQILAQLVPGQANGRQVEIRHRGNRNFSVTAEVNGARIPMVLDTGASAVVLTHDAAKAAGLPLEVLSYTVKIDTANGRTRAAPVTLDHIAIGGIVEREVSALIAQPGHLRASLLGMTFLNRLESWEVRDDKLVMRGHP